MGRYGQGIFNTGVYGENDDTVLAGVTHHAVLSNLGLMLGGVASRSDITSSIPRVSVGIDQKKHTDFSERDTFGQGTWHHGRGALDFDDPSTFFDQHDIVTWIGGQVTLRPKYQINPLAAGGFDLAGDVIKVLPFAGNMYVIVAGTLAADNEAYWIDTGDESLNPVTSTAVIPTSGTPFDAVVFGSGLIVSYAGSGTMWRITATNTGGTFAQTAGKLAVYDGLLWGARSSSDNTIAIYSTAGTEALITPVDVGNVGSSAYPIRGMVAGFDGALWVGKDDGLYSVRPDGAGGYVIDQVIDLLPVVSSANGRAMCVFGGNLYMSVSNTIMRYDGSTVQFMGPDKGAHETEKFHALNTQFGTPLIPQSQNLLPPTYQAGVVGNITHLAHDSSFLYALADNKGLAPDRIYVWGGTGWHTLVVGWDVPGSLTGLWFTGEFATSGLLSYPVYWFSADVDGSKSLNNIKWSRHSHNPLDDTSLEYESTGWFTTPWFDAGLFDLEKVIFTFIVSALGLTASGEDIDVEFQVDDYDVWYTLGTVTTTPEGVLYFPDNTKFDPSIFCKKIRYRITLNRSATTTNTPVLKSWGHQFVVRPDTRYGWSMSVAAYNSIQRLDRLEEKGQGLIIRDTLAAMRDSNVPLQFTDGRQLDPLFNEVLNPSFERDSDGDGLANNWLLDAFGSTSSLNAQYKVAGIFSQKVVTNDTNNAGLAWSTSVFVVGGSNIQVSANLYIESGDPVSLQVFYEPAGPPFNDPAIASKKFIKPVEGVNSARFTRQTIFLEDVEEGYYSFAFIRTEDDATAATTFYVDAVEFYHSKSWLRRPNLVYIDGDQIRCRWVGTPRNSRSVRQYGYFTYITAMTDIERYSENTANEGLDYNGDITLELRETT